MKRLSIPLTVCTALLALASLPAQPEQAPPAGEGATALTRALDGWVASTDTPPAP